MKGYLYKIVQIQVEFKSILIKDKNQYNEQIEEKLNKMGEDGWELSGVDGTWFYFKKELD